MKSTEYTCAHALQTDEGQVCSLGICENDDLEKCCHSCDMYKGADRGFGDTVKNFTAKLGMKTCGACEERRKKLNRITSKFYGKKD